MKLTFNKLANNNDKDRNKMNVLVHEWNDQIKNNKLKKSEEIICPNCKESIRIKIEDYKIGLFGCKNNHKFENLTFDQFEDSQNIDESTIICDKCKKTNKSNTFSNEFYKCNTCKYNLCPLCKKYHEQSHNIINYDLKYFICEIHNEKYISYCNNCLKNKCALCMDEDNNNHKIDIYKIPNINNKINELEEFKNIIDQMYIDINSIIEIINDVKKSIDKYYNLCYKVINNYELKKRNYEKLENINCIINKEILNDIKEIINENNINNKFDKILEINDKFKNNNMTNVFKSSDLNNSQNEDLNKKENNLELNKIDLKFEDINNINEKTINCRKLAKSILNDKIVNITIRNPKEMSGGIFGKNYILYEVKTDPFDWIVYRKFDDFYTLRNLIKKDFPSFYVPPLPDKKKENLFVNNKILNLIRYLNLFINHLVQSESFKTSEILIAFLKYDNRKKLDSIFKEYSSRKLSLYVEDYKTLDGKIIISQENNEKYFININKFFTSQSQILYRLNCNLKSFNNNMFKACEDLQGVKTNFEILQKLNIEIKMKIVIIKSYEELSVFFANYQKVLLKQSLLIKDHMKRFFKYINLEGKAYIELIDKREELKAKYNDEKEKPYKNEIYNQLGYANKRNITEFTEIINGYCKRYIDNIKRFDEQFYQTINDLVGTWSNLETLVMSSQQYIN